MKMNFRIEELTKGEELVRCINPLDRWYYITIIDNLSVTDALSKCDELALKNKGTYRVVDNKTEISIYNITSN